MRAHNRHFASVNPILFIRFRDQTRSLRNGRLNFNLISAFPISLHKAVSSRKEADESSTFIGSALSELSKNQSFSRARVIAT